jgi:hypothetical protein
MSLKTFHLFFLIVAILFDFGFAAFAYYGPESDITKEIRPLGIGSGIFGVGLIAYGVWYHTKKAPSILI